MFCPNCGTLSFPSPIGHISCSNYKCGYMGPVGGKISVNGKDVDLSSSVSTIKAENQNLASGVIKDSEQVKGQLTVGDYMCPRCNSEEIYSYLEPLLDMAEVLVTMLTCKECGLGWREH